jgi:hypothetical protein
MESLENRVVRLEWTSETHETRIKELADQSKVQTDKLVRIEQILSQIKWVMVGAMGVLAFKELGITKFLTFLMG